MTGEDGVNTVYKASECKALQIRDHKAVLEIDKERLDQGWRNKEKIAYFYVESKDRSTDILFDLELLREDKKATLTMKNTDSSYLCLTQSWMARDHIAHAQKHWK